MPNARSAAYDRCARFVSRKAFREDLREPYGITWEGSDWIVGADGCRMLLVLGSAPEREKSGPTVELLNKHVKRHDELLVVDLEKLATAVNAPLSKPGCKNCECDDCVGPYHADEFLVVEADRVKWNVHLVAQSLTDAEALSGEAQLTRCIGDLRGPWTLRGDDWIIVGMPAKPDADACRVPAAVRSMAEFEVRENAS